MSVKEIIKAEPFELERWAHEWLRVTTQRIRAVIGNEQLARQEFASLLQDVESILAIVVITMVKDEYQEDVAELIDAIRELQQSLRGSASPSALPGMPRA